MNPEEQRAHMGLAIRRATELLSQAARECGFRHDELSLVFLLHSPQIMLLARAIDGKPEVPIERVREVIDAVLADRERVLREDSPHYSRHSYVLDRSGSYRERDDGEEQ